MTCTVGARQNATKTLKSLETQEMSILRRNTLNRMRSGEIAMWKKLFCET